MKALVTGSAGFIGSHLCERLIADGHTVIGVDNLSSGTLVNMNEILKHQKFHFVKEDIRRITAKHFDGVDWVFHLAAKADIVPSIELPTYYHNNNVSGTVGVLECARTAKVKRFIYAASSSCYGIPLTFPTTEQEHINPEYPYAMTKYLGEQYVLHWSKVYGLPGVSLRLFNVYGPRSRTSGAYGAVFGVFLAQMCNNYPLTIVGDGDQKRDFTFVTDVVDAFVRAAESDVKGVFNIGSGEPQTINRLAELLGATDKTYIPTRPGEPNMTWAYSAKARHMLDWEPKVSFEKGVAIMKDLIPTYKDSPLWTKESIAKATDMWFATLGTKQ